MPLVNQQFCEEIIGSTCGNCIYSDAASSPEADTKIFLCYNATSPDYQKVRGGEYGCEHGEDDDGTL